ncbi:MAG: sulfurtransferase TusA family protein [Actinomycetota bacterium]|nr:sulfurtransferase TusA family protein [Actinomycetota bacterium]
MTEPPRWGPPERVADALGKRCPLPVIELARAVAGAPAGAVVEVLADDEAARLDIPAWCAMRGHEYLGERTLDDGRHGSAFAVRRSA